MTFRVLGGVVTQRISDRRVRSKCPYQKLSIHFLVSLVAILIFVSRTLQYMPSHRQP
jgi:hypothetical protein